MTDTRQDESARAEKCGRIILKTERLVFRELVIEDAPFVLELLTQPSFLEFIGDRDVHDIEAARRYILEEQSQYTYPGYGSYAVLLKDAEISIGISGLIKRDSLPCADIGFAYLPKYWRQGYAFEGAEALLKYAKKDLGLCTVIALTSPLNTASQNLLKKLGMTFKRHLCIHETGESVLLFAPD